MRFFSMRLSLSHLMPKQIFQLLFAPRFAAAALLAFSACVGNATELKEFVDQYKAIQKASSDERKLALSEQLSEAMVAHWTDHELETDASEILGKRMGFASAGSGQDRLAVVSWNVELNNQTQAYGAVVIFRGRKGEQIAESLQFKRSTTLRNTLDTKSRYTPKDWPGAVYYEVLIQHQGSRPVYTLLGWDGADNIRTRKIVETLTISGTKLKFGVPIISAGRGSTKRYILEYSDQVSAILQWREDLDMIVMDHLSPPSEELEGQTAYYGPDMSYDGFVWKKNQWVLQEDVDVRDPKVQGPWNNPKRLRRRARN